LNDDVPCRELQDSSAPLPKTGSSALALTAFTCQAITAVALLVIVPKFDAVFRHVQVPMPSGTADLMALSRAACLYSWAVIIALVAIPLIPHRCKSCRASFLQRAILSLALLGWAWMVVMLFLPLIGTLGGQTSPALIAMRQTRQRIRSIIA
jgi:type II secretory pathway component PulF